MKELVPELVARCRRQEPQAFRTLVEVYQDRVYALCRALAGPDAEDLAQETFIRVHASIPAFEPDGAASLGGWILLIARRQCSDRARGARQRFEHKPSVDAIVVTIDPEQQLAQTRLGARLVAAIDALPEEQRAVIALREWDGLGYEEIAAIEDVPVGTVRSRLARAREALRQSLTDLDEARVRRAIGG